MIIDNKAIAKDLAKKDELIKQARKVTQEIEVLEKKRAKLGLQVQKIKDKVIPFVEREVSPNLNEFEQIERVDLKDGKIEVTTYDAVEEFKKHYREQLAKKSSN